jgi:membrane protease YdiL (CAAX protease family)
MGEAMDILYLLTVMAALLYCGGAVFIANQEDLYSVRDGVLRWMLYGVAGLTFLFGLTVFQAAVGAIPETQNIDSTAAGVNFVFAALASFLILQLINSERLRVSLRKLMGEGAYRPESRVHLTAMVLALMLLSVSIGNFVLSGGLEGLAQSYAQGINAEELIFEQALWVLFALLGVGALIRRNWLGALSRLGLRLPTAPDFAVGIGAGIGLYAVIIALGAVWALLVTPEQLEAQTAASSQLAQAFSTIPTALILSLAVAVGEEVFFRGALQPIFGIGLTSVFFTLLHTQYTLTPATIGIFAVSLGMGWLRQRYSTTAAITAHFVYNFVQLALAILAGSMMAGG